MRISFSSPAGCRAARASATFAAHRVPDERVRRQTQCSDELCDIIRHLIHGNTRCLPAPQNRPIRAGLRQSNGRCRSAAP